MYVRIEEQLLLFFASLVCGALLSVFYDLIRMSRMAAGVHYGGLSLPCRSDIRLPLLPEKKQKPRRRVRERALCVLVFVGDVLFFVVAAFCMLCVFFNYGGGKVRGAGLFVAAVGFFACHFTVGAVVIRLFGVIRLALGVALEYLTFFILFPVRKLIFPVVTSIWRVIRDFVSTAYLRAYTKKYEKNAVDTLCGLKSK